DRCYRSARGRRRVEAPYPASGARLTDTGSLKVCDLPNAAWRSRVYARVAIRSMHRLAVVAALHFGAASDYGGWPDQLYLHVVEVDLREGKSPSAHAVQLLRLRNDLPVHGDADVVV